MKYARGGMTSLDYLMEIQRLENQLKKYEWVSVKDSLPEKDGFYLAWFTFKGNGHTRDIFYYNCDAPMPSSVTHQMPLPEPPESEDGAE